jgi:trehalose 6-phosphate synthase
MQRALRFALVLVAGLGLLAWVALVVANDTARRWFEKDVALRAELVMNGSRLAILTHWRDEAWKDLRALLVEITRDERIMAAAACDPELRMVARTTEYPDRFPCSDIAPHVRPAADAPSDTWGPWRSVTDLPGGQVHLSALPILDHETPLGFVVLVHDLSFVARREGTMRLFLLGAFGVLGACASVVTAVAVRLSWRSWSN